MTKTNNDRIRLKEMEITSMFEKIVAVISILICLGGVIWGWWIENGPEKGKDTEKRQKDKTEKSQRSEGLATEKHRALSKIAFFLFSS